MPTQTRPAPTRPVPPVPAAMFPVKQQEEGLFKISLLDFDPELVARFRLLTAARRES